jgi:hypothetical protein
MARQSCRGNGCLLDDFENFLDESAVQGEGG